MGLQSLFIVNKAGSLIFYRKLSDAAPQLTQNDYIHLASTFHGYVSISTHSTLTLSLDTKRVYSDNETDRIRNGDDGKGCNCWLNSFRRSGQYSGTAL